MKLISFATALAYVFALKPRDFAPDFANVNAILGTTQQTVSLSDYKDKWLVMLFYPFDFTYVCPTELIAFSDAIKQFEDLGASVIGISGDSQFTHLAWAKTPRSEGGIGALSFPLLADISKQMASDYGVLVTDKTDKMYGAALRGLFLLDKTHKVRAVQINDDSVGRSVDEAIRLINAFQFADKHGEVCPANWHPGDKTIIPDQA
jgi:peroxiredoxin (alkyl hydroperoxide reductase subunit C)